HAERGAAVLGGRGLRRRGLRGRLAGVRVLLGLRVGEVLVGLLVDVVAVLLGALRGRLGVRVGRDVAERLEADRAARVDAAAAAGVDGGVDDGQRERQRDARGRRVVDVALGGRHGGDALVGLGVELAADAG